jgi:putative ABC transport system permease protein
MTALFLGHAAQDIRYALHTLRRSRTFAAAVITTLALAIAANTTMLSLVEQVLVRPLPYRDAGRLFVVAEGDGSGNYRAASYQTFLDWQRQSRTLAGLAFVRGNSAILRTSSGLERAASGAVTRGFFTILGVHAALGRTFAPEEERGLGGDVAVLSNELWQSRFGGDRGIIGATMDYDNASVRIIGILPPGVSSFFPPVGIWRPLAGDLARDPALGNRNFHVDSRVVGRLADGATIDKARAEFRVIQRRLAGEYPAESSGWTTGEFFTVREMVVGDVENMLLLLAAGVLVVLLIACANVSNLSLTRAITRDREMAIRQALGASRGRLTRQLLTESAVIVLIAGGVGFLASALAIRAIRANAPIDLPRVSELIVDWHAGALTTALSLLTLLIVGGAPLLRLRTPSAANPLRQGRSETASAHASRLRMGLSVGQLGLATALLLCGGLLLESLRRIQHVDLGYDPTDVVSVMLVAPPDTNGAVADPASVYARILAAARNVRGVTSAALINHLPGSGGVPTRIVLPGRGDAVHTTDVASYRSVSASYFETMRIPLLHGRGFTEDDIRSPGDGIVISQSVAERYWPGRDPTGEPITIFGSSQFRPDYGMPQPSHVIGVVADVKVLGPEVAERHADVYVPFSRANWPGSGLVARIAGKPSAIIPALRKAIAAADPAMPIAPAGAIGGIGLLNEALSRSLSTRRYTTALLGGFAASALLLALIGVYGVIAYGVTQRTREFGVRFALGAQSGDVFSLILKQGLSLSLLGVVVGVGGGLAASRMFTTLLYGTSATDPMTFVVVPAVVFITVMLACAIPARRAARLDPIMALRVE